jgi:hypothetical protein
MQSTLQTIRAEPGKSFLADLRGAQILYHHSAVGLPRRSDALVGGLVVESVVELSPQGLRDTTAMVFVGAGHHIREAT